MAELVAAYRRGVPVEEVAASFRVNRTTVLGHVRRHGVPKRDRRVLGPDAVRKAVHLYGAGLSAESVAEELQVAATTVRRALTDAGVTLRPKGRPPRSP
ncbi:MAG: helix-turn-helix domain-containing protein [Acidimicrobiales bacterium]